MDRELMCILTRDGSKTLYSSIWDEIYHSRNGAITESKHVFIRAGFACAPVASPSILEVGVGTGLNLFMTVLAASDEDATFTYVGLEPDPPSIEKVRACAYFEALGIPEPDWLQPFFSGQTINHNGCSFSLLFKGILEHHPSVKYDVIYFDAFGPATQPWMWTVDVFQHCNHLLAEGGMLVTYCAKGEVGRILKSAGFMVERLSGPPGKREMIRATKGQ
jgi:tRNA U34 5-methylaminomethyl-2-thiouridine-forming methyltransferase MnmC